MKRKVTVWSNPNDPDGFRLLIDEPPVIQCSVNERSGSDSPGGGSLTIPADYEHLNLILEHDPSSVADNYSSLIVVEQDDGDGWYPVFEFYAEDTDEQLSDGGQVTIVGPHIKAGADDGVVGPRHPKYPHWEWGAPTLTRNADLSESSTTSEEIRLWVSAGASGSFTVDVEASGTPATIDVGDSASDVKTALEGLSTVAEVRVSGAGTVADPWHVIFVDPGHQDLFIQTNDSGLTGSSSLAVVVEGGQASPSFWLKSQSVDGVIFGAHTGSSHRVVPDPLDPDLLCIEVNGTAPFTGEMQILDVDPGPHYGTVEVLPANDTEQYRYVLRSPDEGFVASSGGSGGYEGITLTDGVWNTVTTGQFDIDELAGGRVFARIAVVSEGNPGTFYVRNMKVHPGFPATTAGEIVRLLKDGAEDRGALDWLANDFSDIQDSKGVVWDTSELAFQADAGEKLGTHVLGDLAASTGVNKTSVGGGYEWEIVRVADDESGPSGATHWLRLYNPGTMGGVSSQQIVVGTLTGGRVAKRRVPFTHLLVRTYDGEHVWVTDSRLAGIPRREEFYSAEQARDVATAEKIGGQVFDAMIENLFATEVQLGGPGVRAYRDFGVGWTVPYVLGAKRAGRHERRIHSIVLGFDGVKWTDTVHASRMYAPGGKDSPLVLEGLAKLYRLFDRGSRVNLRRRTGAVNTIGLAPPPGGGGGQITVVIAASDANQISKDKADYVCTGTNDEATIQTAIDTLTSEAGGKNGLIQLTEGIFAINVPASPFYAINLRGLNLRGAGQDSTVLAIQGNTNANGYALRQFGKDTEISDLSVRRAVGLAFTTSTPSGISINGSDNKISRCHFVGISGAAATIYVGNGMNNVHIDNCWFNQTGANAIHLEGSHYATVDRCRFRDITGTCVYVDGGGTKDSITIRNCQAEQAGGRFAYLDFVTDSVVSGNTVQASEHDVIVLDACARVHVHDNISHETGGHGVSLIGSSDCDIHDNFVYWPGWWTGASDGIRLAGNSDNNLIHHNRIIGASGSTYGINVSASTCDTNRIVGNVITGTYGTDQLNDAGTGTVLSYPAHGTYGDNFT